MKVLFRADSSTKIGTGHVMRCLALAEYLKSQGVEITFASRRFDGNINSQINQSGFETIFLENLEKHRATDFTKPGKHWLCTDPQHDFDEMKKSISSEFDWLIVDHYGIELEWESLAREVARKILVIDDLSHEKHNCDALLNQNFVPRVHSLYQREEKYRNVKMLLGPDYSLLREEFRKKKSLARARREINNILIFMSGTDPYNITSDVLDAISTEEFSKIHFDVVLGTQNRHRESILKKWFNKKNIKLIENTNEMSQLMIKADLAIGAAGTVSWERACLGLPTIVISLASNQTESAEELHNYGAIDFIFTYQDFDTSILRTKLRFYNNDAESLYKMSLLSTKLVDGKGVERVSDLLFNRL